MRSATRSGPVRRKAPRSVAANPAARSSAATGQPAAPVSADQPSLTAMPDARQLFLRSRGLYEADARVELHFYFTMLLTQFSRRWRNRLNEKLAEIGQTQARLESLFWIEVSEGRATQRELAERVGIEGPTLARMLDRLEKEGLVERRPSADDRRTKTIALKKRAAPFLKQMRGLTDQLRAEILQDVESCELSACVNLMRALLSKLERR